MKIKLGVLIAALTPLLLGASAGSPAIGAPQASATVRVTIGEWSFKPSARTVPPGKVTFLVRNAGTMKHEFVVLRSDLHHHLLKTKDRQASEAGIKGKIAPFGPGNTKRLTLTLAPGKYVLICNVPGHYKRGQYLAFTVKPGATTAPQTTDVNVSLFEMGFKLSKTTVPRGTVVFHLKNDGKLPHDFSFGSRGGGSPMLQSGQSATFTAKFAMPGKYTFICTVEGHQESGMIGVLTVT